MKTFQFTVQAKDKVQIEALIAYMNALHIPFEIQEEVPYSPDSPELTQKLQKSIQQAKNGEVKKLNLDDIWSP